MAKKFRKLETSLSLHLIEISPVLSEIQEKTLTGDIVQNGEEMDDKKVSVSSSFSATMDAEFNIIITVFKWKDT